MLRALCNALRLALWKAFRHNALVMAKAAAYSQLLSLFPALLVGTSLLAQVPTTESVRGDIRTMLVDLLPADTMELAQRYFESTLGRSPRLLISAGVIAFAAEVGVMLSLMEGFRQAYGLPRGGFGFWMERLVALALIPSTLLPMVCATAFVVFGHQIELWMVANADHTLRPLVLISWRCVRWITAMTSSVGMLMVIYHFGVSLRPPWLRVLPGAVLATVSWFLSTMLYGWYVTRFADYSIVYGPIGAVIATMVWLYIVSLAMLIGAEFNAQVHPLLAVSRTVQDDAGRGLTGGDAYASRVVRSL